MEENGQSKTEIRRRILKRRDGLGPEERKRSEILITERILGHQWYYGAGELLVFISYGSEVDTAPIWEEARRQGKKVYAPCVLDGRMEFYRMEGRADLRPGYRGILEPAEPEKREKFVFSQDREKNTLMLMPGVAFDVFRGRLGYGRGFYDRYLADKAALRTIAIGYSCQMVDKLPTEDTDIRPMQVICL